MKVRPKIGSLDAHLAVRRKLASARREAHSVGHVVNVMLEIEREIARLDVRILDLEEKIARLSDEHKPQRKRFDFFGLFEVDLVVNDKKQQRELVAVLRSWRELLANQEGARAVRAAKTLSRFLTDAGSVEDPHDEEPHDEEPPTNNGPPNGALNGSAAKPGRWG